MPPQIKKRDTKKTVPAQKKLPKTKPAHPFHSQSTHSRSPIGTLAKGGTGIGCCPRQNRFARSQTGEGCTKKYTPHRSGPNRRGAQKYTPHRSVCPPAPPNANCTGRCGRWTCKTRCRKLRLLCLQTQQHVHLFLHQNRWRNREEASKSPRVDSRKS